MYHLCICQHTSCAHAFVCLMSDLGLVLQDGELEMLNAAWASWGEAVKGFSILENPTGVCPCSQQVLRLSLLWGGTPPREGKALAKQDSLAAPYIIKNTTKRIITVCLLVPNPPTQFLTP